MSLLWLYTEIQELLTDSHANFLSLAVLLILLEYLFGCLSYLKRVTLYEYKYIYMDIQRHSQPRV